MAYSCWPTYTQAEIDKVTAIMRSGRVNYWTGEYGLEFESEFAKFVGCDFAVACSNGTIALELVLRAINVQKGDEVIVPPRSFVATASACLAVGAKPVFCDLELATGNICPTAVSNIISPRTKAIICVHLGGTPSDVVELKKIARDRGIFLIEDCAQAHGAQICLDEVNWKSVGSFGDAAVWSFCTDKIISTLGEGGMITTSDSELFSRIWSLKDHGKERKLRVSDKKYSGAKYQYVHHSYGTNARLTEAQAAVGLAQLSTLESVVSVRRQNQDYVWNAINDLPLFRFPTPNFECKQAAYKGYIFLNSTNYGSKVSNESVLKIINRDGLVCMPGSCCELHKEKVFKNMKQPKLRNAKILARETIQFWVDPTVSIQYLDLVVSRLVEAQNVFGEFGSQ